MSLIFFASCVAISALKKSAFEIATLTLRIVFVIEQLSFLILSGNIK
jgi:hypothetical protein